MWPVSTRFAAALPYPHRRVTTVTVTPPGGAATTLDIEGGTVTVAGDKGVRRRATFTVTGSTTEFAELATPGAVFSIVHGLNYGDSSETVPVFYGELTKAQQTFGEGSIVCDLSDLGVWLARCVFTAPYSATAATTRIDAIEAVVEAARPGTTVTNESSDTGTIGADQVWTTGPLDVIDQLTNDGGTEAFFLPDGTFTIRDRRTSTSSPVWLATGGNAGVITSVARTRPQERLYNTVIVQPATTDGSQTWTQQTATVTDTEHDRHPDNIGTVPYFYKSPTIATAAEALATANLLLDRVLGTTETLQIGGISNPALEANEPIRVITPNLPNDPATAFQHFVDTFTLDLATGGMTLSTRSQGVEVD